jgi:CRP/FNR family transcriptional regulator, anaerobic regulatory protein
MPQLFRSPRLHQLLMQGRLLRYKRNEVLASTKDKHGIMMIRKGYVKRYFIGSDGSLGVQIIYGPQDVFSFTKIFELLLGQSIYDGPETYYYQTMTDTQLYVLSKDQFTDAIQRDPLLYRELFSEVGRHLKTCVHRIENISLANAYAQVAHEILFSAKEFGIPAADGVRLPLTHQDIADILGTTRETVTKAIVRLRNEGIVDNTRHLRVLDYEGLERAAYR